MNRNLAAEIFHEINTGLLVINSNHTVEFCNQWFLNHSDSTEEEIVGTDLTQLSPRFKEPRPQHAVTAALEFGISSVLSHSLHKNLFPLQKRGGEVIDHAVSIRPLHVDEQWYALIEISDVSSSTRRERTLHKIRQEIEKVSHAKDEFLASMSHELRTPLTAIIGNSEILSETHLNAEQQDILQVIEVSGRHQLALVNDILDLSKIESGKFEINESPFDLDALISDVQRICVTQIDSGNVQFRIEQDVHFGCMLIGDGQRIGQVLINLLSNAFKFTDRGEVVLKVWQASDQLMMSVSDQGIGMAPDVLNRLFLPFEQADSSISGRFGGTGLGLHISRALVNLMGGTITVESEEGKGSLFQFAVPLVESDLPLTTGIERQQSRQLYFQGHVLVAEDNPDIQNIERKLLEETGLQVTVVKNGREAVDQTVAQIAAHPFDLILMDMQMPVMDGIEATQTIRVNGVTTPIIAVTANVMQKHKEAFSEAGCNEFLEKPIDKEALFRALERYLPHSLEQPRPRRTQADDSMVKTESEQPVETQENRGTPTDQLNEEEITEIIATMLHDFGNQITALRPYYTELTKARVQGRQLSQGLLEQQKKINSGEEVDLSLGEVGEAMELYVENYLGEGLDSTCERLESMVNSLRAYRDQIKGFVQ